MKNDRKSFAVNTETPNHLWPSLDIKYLLLRNSFYESNIGFITRNHNFPFLIKNQLSKLYV